MEFRDWLDEPGLGQFYQTIDVFAHARADGETLGVSIAEAMLAQNPIITHVSKHNNEHLEFLRGRRFARIARLNSVDDYFGHMRWFIEHAEAIPALGLEARAQALQLFERRSTLARIVDDVEQAAHFRGSLDRLSLPRRCLSAIYHRLK